MRVLAVIFLTWPCLAEPIPKPIRNVLDCSRSLGPVKCLNALSSWRAERALTDSKFQSKLTDDLEQFPWRNYSNRSDEELHSQLCDETEKLLRRRPLSLSMPGYRFELLSSGNGTLNFDVYRDADSGRGMKKIKKTFYKILPLLIVPGLMMSAVIPFMLPALKMMTLLAGVINNMAFTGAVFTLLRNNAFNDNYEHKVIYVNEGYKNEKHAHFKHGNTEEYEVYEEHEAPEHETIEELPLNSDWIKDYYGPSPNQYDHVRRESRNK